MHFTFEDSAKSFSLLSISRIDHILDLRKFAKQSLFLQILMLTPQFSVVSQASVCVSPPHQKKSVAQSIKMYLNNVLLKMGQGPYVFIISQ